MKGLDVKGLNEEVNAILNREWDQQFDDECVSEKGAALLKDAADRGIVEAQYRYGKLCMFSDAYDIRDGFKFLESAAAAGCFAAADLIGSVYFDPDYRDGIEEGLAEKFAFEYSLQAAKAGFVYSQCRLCYMYALGRGVEKNESEAVRWLEVSCTSPFTPTRFARNVKMAIEGGSSIVASVEKHLPDLLTVVDGPGTFVSAMAADISDGGCNSKDGSKRTVLCRNHCGGTICGLLHMPA